MAVWKSIHQKFPLIIITRFDHWTQTVLASSFISYLYFLLLRLRFCNSCPPFVLQWQFALLICTFSIKNSTFLSPLCAQQQLHVGRLPVQTAWANLLWEQSPESRVIRTLKPGLLWHWMSLFFMSGHAAHTACAVISICCVIDNCSKACTASNTRPEYWLYAMNLLSFLSFKAFFLKRTICLFVDQAEQFDPTHQKRKDVLFAKSGKPD